MSCRTRADEPIIWNEIENKRGTSREILLLTFLLLIGTLVEHFHGKLYYCAKSNSQIIRRQSQEYQLQKYIVTNGLTTISYK